MGAIFAAPSSHPLGRLQLHFAKDPPSATSQTCAMRLNPPLPRALGFLVFSLTFAAFARAQVDLGITSTTGETVDVDLVTVEVRVTDGNGRPLEGLHRGDFRLLEDGRAVSISHFAAVST